MDLTAPLLACSLLVAPASADLLAPGHKGVEHTLLLEGELRGHHLLAAPTAGFGTRPVVLGEPFSFSSKYGTRLWALPEEVAFPERWDAELFEGITLSADLPGQVASVPMLSPLASVRTTLRVVGLDRSELELEFVSEERFGAEGQPVGEARTRRLLYAVAAVGIVLAAYLFIRRRRCDRQSQGSTA